MKNWLVGITLSALAVSVNAGEMIDETMSVDRDVFVDIEHMNGDAEIFGWDKAEIKVVGELDDRAEEFIFEKRGSRVIIHVKMPKRQKNWNNSYKGDDLQIYVPRTAQVQYEAVNADVQIKDLEAGLKADTVNGDIEVKDVSGRINLQSVNGHIDADDLSGDIRFDTVNGVIRDKGSSGSEIRYDSVNGDIYSRTSISDVTAETVNGGIEMELDDVQKIELVTVNGAIDASMDLMDGGSVEGSNVSGRISIALQRNVSAEFDISSHAGGRLVNKLTDHKVRKAKYGPGRWLEFTTGDGKGKVELSTVSGRIEVKSHN